MGWDAFLSYSHAADGRLAPAVQTGLQRLAKPWYRRRALRVFRDQTGLAVDPRLWGSIQQALDDTNHFVLLTSPQAAASKWVNREIDYWLTHRDPEALLPVVTEGEWVWRDDDSGFDLERSTAVPPALARAFQEEPLFLDLRWARNDTQVNLRNGRFRDAMADLAAPIHGRPKDDLVGEDIRLHRRARRLAWGAAIALVALTVAAVAAALLAVRNAAAAEERRVEAVAQRLALESRQNSDRPSLAFLLATEAYRMDPSLETEGAVRAAVQSFEAAEVALLLRGDQAVHAAAVDPERDLIVVGEGGTVAFYDRRSGASRAEASIQPDVVADLLVDPAPSRLLVVGVLGVGFWDLETLTPVGEMVPADAPILSADLLAGGDLAVFGHRDGTVSVWDTATRTEMSSLAVSDHSVLGVAMSPDGSLVAVALDGGGVGVWPRSSSAQPVWFDPAAHVGSANAVAFDSTGDRLVSGGGDGIVRVWGAGDGERLFSRAAHTGIVWDVRFSSGHPLGDYIASASDDGAIGWMDAATYVTFPPTLVHDGPVNALQFAADGTYASAGQDGLVGYFDARHALDTAATRVEMGSVVAALALDAESDQVAVGRAGEVVWLGLDGTGDRVTDAGGLVTALALDPATGRLIVATGDGAVAGHADGSRQGFASLVQPAVELAVAPDGRWLAGIDGAEEVWTWDVRSESESDRARSVAGGWRGLSFSPAGDRMAVAGSPYQVAVVDPATGEEVARLGGPLELFFTTAFHPSEPVLAGADSTGRVRFWDTTSWSPSGEPLIGHEGLVTAISFSGDGATVITSGSDGTVRLWDFGRRSQIGEPIRSHRADVVTMEVYGEPPIVVTGSADGTVLIRDLSIEAWIEETCALVGRDLTASELEAYQVDRPHQPLC